MLNLLVVLLFIVDYEQPSLYRYIVLDGVKITLHYDHNEFLHNACKKSNRFHKIDLNYKISTLR